MKEQVENNRNAEFGAELEKKPNPSEPELSDLLCVDCGKTDFKQFDNGDNKIRCEECAVLFYKAQMFRHNF